MESITTYFFIGAVSVPITYVAAVYWLWVDFGRKRPIPLDYFLISILVMPAAFIGWPILIFALMAWGVCNFVIRSSSR